MAVTITDIPAGAIDQGFAFANPVGEQPALFTDHTGNTAIPNIDRHETVPCVVVTNVPPDQAIALSQALMRGEYSLSEERGTLPPMSVAAVNATPNGKKETPALALPLAIPYLNEQNGVELEGTHLNAVKAFCAVLVKEELISREEARTLIAQIDAPSHEILAETLMQQGKAGHARGGHSRE